MRKTKKNGGNKNCKDGESFLKKLQRESFNQFNRKKLEKRRLNKRRETDCNNNMIIII